jgi:hypothetical protein
MKNNINKPKKTSLTAGDAIISNKFDNMVAAITNLYQNDSVQNAQSAIVQKLKKTKELTFIPTVVYSNLPSILAEACSKVKEQHEKDMLLTACIGSLSVCFPSVSGVYKNKKNHPNLFTWVIAEPASGKGIMDNARLLTKLIHESLKAESDKTIKEWLKQQKIAKAKDDKSVKIDMSDRPPYKALFIPGNTTSSMLYQQLKEYDGNGIIFETEADSLSVACKGEHGNFSDLIRKAFHHEMLSLSRKSNNEYIEIDKPKLSTVLSSTFSQVPKFIQSNADGMFSRFLFYINTKQVEWADVFDDTTDDLDDFYTNKLGQRVHALYTKFKDKNIKFSFTKEQQAVFNEYKKSFATDTIGHSPEYQSIVFRHATMEFRIAMLITSLRYEDKSLTDTIECSNDDFAIALILGFIYFNHAEYLYSVLPSTNNTNISTSANKLMAALPDEFETNEAIDIAFSVAKIGKRAVHGILKSLVACNYLEKKAHGAYRKAS